MGEGRGGKKKTKKNTQLKFYTLISNNEQYRSFHCRLISSTHTAVHECMFTDTHPCITHSVCRSTDVFWCPVGTPLDLSGGCFGAAKRARVSRCKSACSSWSCREEVILRIGFKITQPYYFTCTPVIALRRRDKTDARAQRSILWI